MDKKLFQIDGIKARLIEINSMIAIRGSSGNIDRQKSEQIQSIIRIFVENSVQMDKSCQIGIAQVGSAFKNYIAEIDLTAHDLKIDRLISYFYRFVVEFDLSITGSMSDDFVLFQEYVNDNLDSFENRSQQQIKFVNNKLPISITKMLLNSKEMQAYIGLPEETGKIENLINDWNAKLGDKEERVEKLRKSLDSHKADYSFLAFDVGFSGLAKAKRDELKSSEFNMKIFGGLMLLPPLLDFLYVFVKGVDLARENLFFLVGAAVASISLTLMFVYFFRISLRSADSCRAQLLQLELRRELCRFVQGYAEYAKEIDEKRPGALDKFETLIFSGISNNNDSPPSIFEGIERIGELVKGSRGAGA